MCGAVRHRDGGGRGDGVEAVGVIGEGDRDSTRSGVAEVALQAADGEGTSTSSGEQNVV